MGDTRQTDSWVDQVRTPLGTCPIRTEPSCEQSLGRSVKKADTLLSHSGGFSDGGPQNIRSLHDLLQAVQPLHLELFHGYDLPELGFLGEGACYRVMQCKASVSNKTYAVKQVKLPKTSDLGAFQSRVGCVLKDIEVMSHPPLASCENILDLFGYGWRAKQGDIPYLVTEYALYGTMRQFLLHNKDFPGRARFGLCRHVASGLEWLHASGVCHGDLKMENVLVVEHTSASKKNAASLIAKISDFGHSLLLALVPGQTRQKYLGTALYQPPEVSRIYNDPRGSTKAMEAIDLRRCDIWTFGLLCWETMSGGKHYYEHDEMYRLFWQARYRPPANEDSRDMTARAAMENLEKVQNLVPELSSRFAHTALRLIVPPFTQRQIIIILNSTLLLKPEDRINDITAVPLQYRAAVEIAAPSVRLVDRSERKSNWGYECFQRANSSRILWSVKKQMVADFYRSATSSGHRSTTARGAFQYSLALLFGFGIETDWTPGGFESYLQKSQSLGLKVAGALRELLSRHAEDGVLAKEAVSQDTCDPQDAPKSNQQPLIELIKAVDTQPSVDGSKATERYTQLWRDHIRSLNLRIEDAEPSLLGACKRGDIGELRTCITLGADPRKQDPDGATSIHWLFMFADQDINEAVNLLFGAVKDPFYIETRDQAISSWLGYRASISMDPQVPLRLTGTPLAFAVAVGSTKAALLLLNRGADPLVDLSNYGISSEEQPTCPLLLAAYMHQEELLGDLLKPRMLVTSATEPSCSVKAALLTALCNVSTFERLIFHGHNRFRAQERTLKRIVQASTNPPETVARPLTRLDRVLIANPSISELGSCLTRTVSYADSDLSDSLLHAYTLLPSSSDILPSASSIRKSWRSDLVQHRMLTAFEVACKDFYDRKVAMNLILASLQQGGALNDISALSGRNRAINIVLQHRREDLFDWLMDKHVILTVENSEGQTPLHQILATDEKFCGEGRLERILKSGCDINAQDSARSTPIHYAVAKGNTDAVLAILSYEPDLELADHKSDRALHVAARRGDMHILTSLLDAGANIDAVGNSGRTPLAIACLKGHIKTAYLLLQHEPNILLSCLAIIYAHDRKALELLVEMTGTSWIDSGHKNDYYKPETPLSSACANGDVRIVACLLKFGASEIKRDSQGRSPLDYALIGLRDHRVTPNISNLELLEYKPDYDATISSLIPKLRYSQPAELMRADHLGRTSVHYASMVPASTSKTYFTIIDIYDLESSELQAVFRLFNDAAYNFSNQDSHGRACLHHAVNEGNLYAVCSLLAIGRKRDDRTLTNIQDSDGDTPLHLALNKIIASSETADGDEEHSHALVDICFALIEFGADAGIENRSKRTALSLLSKFRLPYQQQALRARLYLNRPSMSHLPYTTARSLTKLLLACAQLQPQKVGILSTLQLWAVRALLPNQAEWPKDYAMTEALGKLLIYAGAEVLSIEYLDNRRVRISLLQTFYHNRLIDFDANLATWIYREHQEAVKSLTRKLETPNNLPDLGIRGLLDDHRTAIVHAEKFLPDGVFIQRRPSGDYFVSYLTAGTAKHGDDAPPPYEPPF